MERIRNEDGAINERFTAGDPTNGGQFPTKVQPYWLNNVQEEIANAITQNGITLDPTSQNQLYQSIKRASPFDVIVNSQEDLRNTIQNVTDGTSIYVRAMSWDMDQGPIILDADSVFIQFAPGAHIRGRVQTDQNQGMEVGQGVLEVNGNNCTILGGIWDFREDPDSRYHAVKYNGSTTSSRPYFGLSRIKNGFLNNTTIPPSAVLTF